jgi:hypothetical protein
MVGLPKPFWYVFLGFPILGVAMLTSGTAATILFILGCGTMLVAFVFAFGLLIRVAAHRNARLYDRVGKDFLPPEYKTTMSNLRGRSRT